MLTRNKIILNVYDYFIDEKQRKRPRFSTNNVVDRTGKATKVSNSRATLFRLIKQDTTKSEEKASSLCPSKAGRKELLDSFDKDFIRQTALNIISENKYLSLKKLKEELSEKKDLQV